MTLFTADDLRPEWLEADGLGGFASGTVGMIRTRRYHALLLSATLPPAGRMVLVNGFDAEIGDSGGWIAITVQRYAPGVNVPASVAPPAAFTLDPWPTWTYALAGGELTQELFVAHDLAAVFLRWSFQGPAGARPFRVRPYLSGRDFHALQQENSVFNFQPETIPGGQQWCPYGTAPAFQVRHNGAYTHQPVWYRQFLYDGDAARGMDSIEDLAAPGLFEFDLAAGPATLVFALAEGLGALPEDSSEIAIDLFDHHAAIERARRASFADPRHRSAAAYLVKRGAGRTIIAGYPWFGDWGRDTFISLRGLCLATGRWMEARDILLAWAGTVSEGMLPNRFPDSGGAPEYNSVDASLWYIVAVHEFLRAAPRGQPSGAALDLLYHAVDAILTGYSQGTRFGIRADDDGLLACGVPGVQLTWMDARIDDRVVTPRLGKPVEIQALWINALAFAGRRMPQWQNLFARAVSSFGKRFWNESTGCLYDVVDADHVRGQNDPRIRPNQLFAVGGLPLALLEGERARSVVQVIEDQLWTPMGPRSLSPSDPDYQPHYLGDEAQRNAAYHQGTVWPWLTGAFIEAWVRVHGEIPEVRAEARRRFLVPELLRLDLPGLQHLPEVADGNAPHTARGCPFQAWSLGELLRLEHQVLNDGAH